MKCSKSYVMDVCIWKCLTSVVHMSLITGMCVFVAYHINYTDSHTCSFSYILSGSFNTSLQCLKINNCDGINDAAVRKTVSSFTSNNLEDTAMAEDIGLFIHSCPRCCASLVWSDLLLMYCFVTCSLRTIEVHGIYCAPHIASNRTCKVLY